MKLRQGDVVNHRMLGKGTITRIFPKLPVLEVIVEFNDSYRVVLWKYSDLGGAEHTLSVQQLKDRIVKENKVSYTRNQVLRMLEELS
jgi:hypothetical protein